MTTTLVRTRLADVHDLEQIAAMHQRCSAETLHRRFHVPLPAVPQGLIRRMIVSSTGWSLVAEQCGEVIGLACAGPLSSTDLEVGLLVEDAHHGTGVGSRLLRDAADEAAARGYQRLVCLTQPDNDSFLRSVRRAGFEGVSTWSDGLLEVAIPLPALECELERPA